MADVTTGSKFILEKELLQRIPLSKATIWRREKQGKFPKRVKLGARKIAHVRCEIDDWERNPEAWPSTEVFESRNSDALLMKKERYNNG